MYNRKRNIIIVMMFAVMLMAAGYALFSTNLNIVATGNLTNAWNVYFSNITEGVANGGG